MIREHIRDDKTVDLPDPLDDGGGAEALVEKAAAIYRGRRSRERIFAGLDLFAEPAWDILLDLFVAAGKHHLISVSSASIAATVAPTTGLRWINILSELGLVARSSDSDDRRRTFLRLTAKGLELTTQAVRCA